jgi:hypothetical protein
MQETITKLGAVTNPGTPDEFGASSRPTEKWTAAA